MSHTFLYLCLSPPSPPPSSPPLFCVFLSASVVINATSKHTQNSQLSSPGYTDKLCVFLCVHAETIHKEIVLSCILYMPGRFAISLLIVVITVRVCVCVWVNCVWNSYPLTWPQYLNMLLRFCKTLEKCLKALQWMTEPASALKFACSSERPSVGVCVRACTKEFCLVLWARHKIILRWL